MRRALLIGLPLIGVLGAGAGAFLVLHRGAPVDRAKLYLAHNDVRGAELLLDRALHDNPNDPGANFEMGMVNLARANPVAAERVFKRARANGYDPKAIILPLGESYLQQKTRAEDILTDFDTAHAPPGGLAAVLTVRASAYLQLRRYAEAQQAADQAIALDPEGVEPQLAGARIAMAANHTDDALARVEKILAKNPNNADTLLIRAEIAMRRAEPKTALELAKKVLDANPVRLDAMMAVARALAALHRDLEASKLVDQVLVRTPRAVDANYTRLILGVRQHDFVAADATLNVLSPVIDDLPQGNYFMAITKLGHGQPAQAQEAAAKYAARNPGDPVALKLLAFTELAVRQPAKALAALQPLKDGGKIDADVLDLTARAEAMMGNLKGAEADLSKASALAPANTDILNRLAAAKLGLGESSAGEADLRASLAKSPNQPVAAETLVQTALARGDYASAEKSVADLRHAVGDTELVGVLSAQVKVAELDLKGAEAEFEDLLKRYPDSRNATFGLIQAEGRLGHAQVAQERLDGWMARFPKDRQGLKLQMQAQTAGGNIPAAIAAAEAAHAADASDTDVTEALAALYMNAKMPDKAISLLDRAGAATNPALGTLRGAALIRAGRIADAKKQLKTAMDAAPAAVPPRLALLELLVDQKEYAAARALAQDGLQLQPGNPRLLEALVRLDLRDGGPDRALATIATLQQDPRNNPAALMLVGVVYESQKDLAKAADAFLAAYKRQPMSATAMAAATSASRAGRTAQRAEILNDWISRNPQDVLALEVASSDALTAHHMVEAGKLLDRVLLVQPNNPVALNNLAWVRMDANDLAGARDVAQRAYYLQPSPESQDTLGWVLFRQGDAERATPLLGQAATAKPTQQILYHYAAGLHATGHNEEARAALQKALANPKAFDERALAEKLQAELGG